LVLPSNLSAIRGDLHVVGTRDGVVSEAEGEVQVDTIVRTIITTDKALYQPGQTMHIRALALSPVKRALANQNFVIRVLDPERVTVFMATARSSRFGVVNADWPIPDNVRLGDYRIAVDREGDEIYNDFSVRISRYDLPNFTVQVEPDRGFYLPGQNAKVKVRADYLFGQPVKRGHVRVVEEKSRDWSFREQQWQTNEGAEYEGETDAQGVFVANVDLTDEHKDLGDWRDSRFNDLTYAAYFTDPTTNRTEQRRFTLRVTREAIHVYVVSNHATESGQGYGLPLRFYVSTFYADGSPARCKVNVEFVADENTREQDRRLRRTIQTNRYGLAKASIDLDDHFDFGALVTLQVRATDSQGGTGAAALDEFSIADETTVFVDTGKSLYSAGEPIVASITSNLPDQTLVVEVAKDWNVIRSERVRLRGGRATVNFPYARNFTGAITIAAYPDFANENRLIGVRSILFPTDSELDLNVRTSQATYRPGEDARVRFNVRTSDGRTAESALGVVVSDKAVDERMRIDSEFGGRYQPHNDLLMQLLGIDVQLSGVSFRDLQRLDLTKPVSPDLDLLAEILLNENRQYYPTFFRGDEYETELATVFGPLINWEIRPVYEALSSRYLRTLQYPTDEKTMREFLREAGIDFQQLHDPWGMNYRSTFATENKLDWMTVWSAGADKRIGTDDDFTVLRMSWEHFKPLGQAIQRIVDSYHKRTGGFIRDRETLRQEFAREGVLLDQKRDRWGQPYRFEFVVKQTTYVIKVSSGGPNGRFAADPNDASDDFTIWEVLSDYFAELRPQIEKALHDKFSATARFPQNDSELREALRDSQQPFETLRDPWNRSYYAIFKTDVVQGATAKLEARATFGSTVTQQPKVTLVTRTIATVTLRSAGADGQQGTQDDFTVGIFSQTIAEQPHDEQREPPSPLFLGNNGAIYGRVIDINGALVPGVTVIATRTPDILRYRTSTDDNGEYLLKDLPPGTYEVRFESPPFVTTVFTSVEVRASVSTAVNATLEPGAVNQTVTVTAQSGSLDTITDATVATSYSSRQVRMGATAKPDSSAAQISTPRLREYFPETLVWQPLVETDGRGRAEIRFKLADNITTWKMAVIGSTEDGRIGTAEKEFKAFQPFFVEHDPPRVLTEGDEISLPVVVRNYLDRLQKVDLEIKTENWFLLTGPARKQATVAAGDAANQTFDFRVVNSVDDGRQRITASGADANDAIEKPVSVHPDGEEVSVTAGGLLIDSASLELNLPDTAIPNSTRAELKIYPNLMAHVMEGVEAIMKRPYGCGEQTISSTYPSLLLLRNYKQTGADFPGRARAERYFNTGYTRLLNYRDENGGFAYWDNTNPDIALTAYALRFLTDASTVIELDQEVIKDARNWLIKQQAGDGSWPPHQFGEEREKRAVLTAYVARILASTESKLVSSEARDEQDRAKFADSLKRAMDYVGQRSNESDDAYLLASYALALIELRDTTRAKPVIDGLRSLALSEGDGSYWPLKTSTPFYGWGNT
ncbi:MAG TPA: MG2 domain-containing protein, partial [Pyrinomonadaceae bacterium]